MSVAHNPLVIGVDSSTQSTKALVVDVGTGDVVAQGQAAHHTSSARECSPEVWWRALQSALRQCAPWSARAGAVSVAGQQHGLVTLDRRGRPVRPALQWNDVRSAPQSDWLVRRLGGAAAWAARVGSVPAPSFTVAKWLWLRDTEPDSAAATAAVRLPHDYLTERLTGAAVTDRGDASGTGWWRGDGPGYDSEILRLIGLDHDALPRVVAPGEAAGPALDLPDLPLAPGTLVAAGTGDNMAAALGLGLRPGQPVLSLGTSGTVYSVSHHRPADPTGTVAGFATAQTGWLPLACTLNCTQAVDRIAAMLNRDREDVEPVPATARGPVALPFLDGERTPQLPRAQGLFAALQADTSGGQLLQAAYDGAVYALLRALDLVLDADSDSNAPILLIGGGARGTAWRETVRRLSGRPVRIPRARELVALGAAAQAAGLLLGEDAAAVARRWRTTSGPTYPALERDEAALRRLAAVLHAAGPLLSGDNEANGSDMATVTDPGGHPGDGPDTQTASEAGGERAVGGADQ